MTIDGWCVGAVRTAGAADLRDKAKRALKAIGAQCCVLGAMQDLLPKAPLPILKVFLSQFEKVRTTRPRAGFALPFAVHRSGMVK